MPQGRFIRPEEERETGPARHMPGGNKAHIGEVQASVWDGETIAVCQDAGVILL